MPPVSNRSIHAVAVLLILLEAVADSVVDCLVCIIAYPIYYHISVTVGAGSIPYLDDYIFPSRLIYRFIVVLYVPSICLWKAGRKVLLSKNRSAHLTHVDRESRLMVTNKVTESSKSGKYSAGQMVTLRVNGNNNNVSEMLKYGSQLESPMDTELLDVRFSQFDFGSNGSLNDDLNERHSNGRNSNKSFKSNEYHKILSSTQVVERAQPLGKEEQEIAQKLKETTSAEMISEEEPYASQNRILFIRRFSIKKAFKKLYSQLNSSNKPYLTASAWRNKSRKHQLRLQAATNLSTRIVHSVQNMYVSALSALHKISEIQTCCMVWIKELFAWCHLSYIYTTLLWELWRVFGHTTSDSIDFSGARLEVNNSGSDDDYDDNDSVLSELDKSRNDRRYCQIKSRLSCKKRVKFSSELKANDSGTLWAGRRLKRAVSWGELVHMRDGRHQNVLRQYNKRWTLYRRLPLKSISRVWGRMFNTELPLWLRKPLISLYIWACNCHLHEASVQDLTQYNTLSQFFRRVLKPGARPINEEAALTSPADGTILHCGPVRGGCLEQVKGVTYSLKGFLGSINSLHMDSEHLSEQNPNLQRSIGDVADNSRVDISQSEGHRRSVAITTSNVNHIPGRASDKNGSNDTDPSKLNDEESSSCQVIQKTLHDSMQESSEKTASCEADDESLYLQQLLTNPVDNSLHQCIIYLAPGDYHRFHSPADWTVFARRHFPGELFSVNPGVARWLQGLFAFNERAVYTGQWQHGFFSLTAVGATNVGSINVVFDKALETNKTDAWADGSYKDRSFVGLKQKSEDSTLGVEMSKGQLFGDFNLGSTIVLLFEAPHEFEFVLQPGTKVRYGEVLGTSV